MITILITDDHPVARAGIRNLLSADPDLVIIGEAENGTEAQQLVEELRPNVLLLDLKMPGPRPAEIERWVRTNHPDTVTLVLTSHDRDAYLSEMMETGISGYLSKSVRGEELIKAIRRAVDGIDLFTDAQRMRVKYWREKYDNKFKELTEREREILKLLCDGEDNRSISLRLGISLRTTAYHITNLLKKLDVDSRQKAIQWAVQYFGEDLLLGQDLSK